MVYADGTLKYHCENDGHAFIRHCAQAIDEVWSLKRVQEWYPHKLAEVKEAMAKLRVQP